MRILVTGASGFVGQHVVRGLCQEHELICLLRNVKHAQGMSGVKLIEADLSVPLNLRLLPKHIDGVLHLAQANVSFPEGAEELFAVNVSSTEGLARYARQAGASHFVFASTGSVYASKDAPLTESDPILSKNFYAETKYSAENLLKWYQDDFNICILRLFVPYGPEQSGRMIPNIINSVLNDKPVLLTNGGQPWSNPIYIDDLIQIMKSSLALKGYHIVNVAGPEIVSVKDIALIVGRALGREPIFEIRPPSTTYNLVGDIQKMRRLFDRNGLKGMEYGIKQILAMGKLTRANH